jgi:asparagine synthase (glutamine-hydrolysing)
MCGITGIYNYDGTPVNIGVLKSMTGKISHRGPDGEGYWINPGSVAGLGHRRLSIIDLSSAGDQPMHYINRYSVVFNGEIYNYPELKEELIKKGHRFLSQSDTEVLLAAYHEYGEDFLRLLDGMFAFAIWDEQEQTLFCARDRFGEKPFFYAHEAGKCFAFGSEIKSLIAFGIPKEIDREMLFYYLGHNMVEHPYEKKKTFYRKIFRLEPAHYLKLGPGGKTEKIKYWDLDTVNTNTSISFAQATTAFRDLLTRSVGRRSDVPVGSSLSGGLDSSSIVCIIQQLRESGQVQKTFSARFSDPLKDEGKYIDLVTSATGVHSFHTWVTEQTFVAELDKVFYHQEEPFSSASIFAQWEVMRLAGTNEVKVLLDGQGADETLAGYFHFFRPYFLELCLRNKALFRKEMQAFNELHGKSYFLSGTDRLKAIFPGPAKALAGLKRRIFTPPAIKDLHPDMLSEFRHLDIPVVFYTGLNEALKAWTTGYGLEKLLRFADRSSMAFSREVRLPFLSHELVEFVFSLPSDFKIKNGWTKRILRSSMEDMLPPEITWRKDKLGFEPPQQQWMQHPRIRDAVRDAIGTLVKNNIIKRPDAGKEWQYLQAAKLMEIKL